MRAVCDIVHSGCSINDNDGLMYQYQNSKYLLMAYRYWPLVDSREMVAEVGVWGYCRCDRPSPGSQYTHGGQGAALDVTLWTIRAHSKTSEVSPNFLKCLSAIGCDVASFPEQWRPSGVSLICRKSPNMAALRI